MKQMIKNHREIETLEDFIYYDKASGKIKIKKELDLVVPIGISLYRHAITVTGATGSLVMFTTSDVKFTSVQQIGKCINFEKFDNGIFLHGNFSGPTSLPTIVAFTNNKLIGPNYVGNQWTDVSLPSGAAVDDLIEKVL